MGVLTQVSLTSNGSGNWTGAASFNSSQLDGNSSLGLTMVPGGGSSFPSGTPTLSSCAAPGGSAYSATGVLTATSPPAVKVTVTPTSGQQLPSPISVNITLTYGGG